MKKLITSAFLLVLSSAAFAQISVTGVQSQFGWAALPGSVRHLTANVTGCTSCLVNWTVQSGSATLSASTSTYPWVDVTLGSTAGSCSQTTSGTTTTGYTLTSTVQADIRATSVEDNTKYADFIVNVCGLSTQVFIAPFFVTLYANQIEDFHSWVFGRPLSQQGVTWAITSQPSGGDGTLSDTGNQDTVFKATVAGRYTITATSTADGTKSSSVIAYVTGNVMPYAATPEKTEPVDCSVDPSLTGHTYTVGAGKTYSTIGAALTAVKNASDWTGSTVLVYNTDTTGTNPTQYAEYFSLPGNATATQPFRICGVPDLLGNLPILQGQNATTSTWTSSIFAGLGGVILWPGSSFGYFYSMNPIQSSTSVGGGTVSTPAPTGIIIEGLHIENFTEPNQYYPPGSSTLTTYSNQAAGLTSHQGYNHVFRGLDIDHNDNGTLIDFNGDNSGWGVFEGLDTWQGDHIHNNSIESVSAVTHQLYLQGWYQLIQGNVIDGQNPGGGGASLKSRGVGDVIRYNDVVQDQGGRALDLVDQQDAQYYIGIDGYEEHNPGGAATPDMPPDVFAGWNEAFHSELVYGNVFTDSTSLAVLHFIGDHGSAGFSRPGWLYAFDNSGLLSSTGYTVLDTDDPNSDVQVYEYPRALLENNIWWDTPADACWNRTPTTIATFTTNLIQAASPLTSITTPISNSDACNLDSGWQASGGANKTFTLYQPIDNHLYGLSSGNFLTDTVQPFNSTTFVPVSGHTQAGTALAGNLSNVPVRFNATLGTAYWQARNTPVTSSAAGIVGGVDATAVVVNSNSAPQMLLLQ